MTENAERRIIAVNDSFVTDDRPRAGVNNTGLFERRATMRATIGENVFPRSPS